MTLHFYEEDRHEPICMPEYGQLPGCEHHDHVPGEPIARRGQRQPGSSHTAASTPRTRTTTT